MQVVSHTSYFPCALSADFSVGKKHVVMGVTVDTFPMMGEALLQTLREKLGDKFTPGVEESWLEVYRALSSEMITAMNEQTKK